MRIWAFLVAAAQEELGILTRPLVQVLVETCRRGRIRIWAFLVAAAQEELGILIWPLVQVFGQNLHERTY